MPRTLPWVYDATASVQKRPIKSKAPPKKRPKATYGSESDAGRSDAESVKGKFKGRTRTPSSSPPPEPPVETLMQEGLDHDDKYRMVEDEFLSVARLFTVHLHTAEYRRQTKLAKSKNAETISSISRPVTQKMSDQTRRKVEGMERSKTQRNVLDLLGQQHRGEDSDDSADGEALPYVGTTLHGLMDSPRKRAIRLAKAGTMAKTTRAAAGYRKPTVHSSQSQKLSESPQSKKVLERAHDKELDDAAESSDEDDDLDAPIKAPKLVKFSSSRSSGLTSQFKSVPTSTSFDRILQQTSKTSKHTEPQSILSRPAATTTSARPEAKEVENEPISSPDRISKIRKRLAQSRLHKAEQEKRDQKKKRLDIIPTFL